MKAACFDDLASDPGLLLVNLGAQLLTKVSRHMLVFVSKDVFLEGLKALNLLYVRHWLYSFASLCI